MDTPRPQLPDFQFHQNNDSFTLHFQQRLILTHSKDNPCLWIGSGIADIDMFRGNFSIKDKLQEKIALTDAIVSQPTDRMDRPKSEQRIKRMTVETFGVDYPAPEKA